MIAVGDRLRMGEKYVESVANLAPRLVDDNLDLSEAYVKDDARVARTVSIA
jgi:hypothetical protein